MRFNTDYTIKAISCTIFPLVIVDLDSQTCAEFVGTGVLFSKNVFITAGHCVNKELPEGQRYSVLYWPEGRRQWNITTLDHITQDPSGIDLASASLDLKPSINISLNTSEVSMGTNVFTYSYPLTNMIRHKSKGSELIVRPNLFKGYVSGIQPHNTEDYKKGLSYEVLMPPLPGISGALLICEESGTLLGIMYGFCRYRHTKQDFTLAHCFENICNMRGLVTDNLPLKEYLEI